MSSPSLAERSTIASSPARTERAYPELSWYFEREITAYLGEVQTLRYASKFLILVLCSVHDHD